MTTEDSGVFETPKALVRREDEGLELSMWKDRALNAEAEFSRWERRYDAMVQVANRATDMVTELRAEIEKRQRGFDALQTNRDHLAAQVQGLRTHFGTQEEVVRVQLDAERLRAELFAEREAHAKTLQRLEAVTITPEDARDHLSPLCSASPMSVWVPARDRIRAALAELAKGAKRG